MVQEHEGRGTVALQQDRPGGNRKTSAERPKSGIPTAERQPHQQATLEQREQTSHPVSETDRDNVLFSPFILPLNTFYEKFE